MTEPRRVLVVDDEVPLTALIADYLRRDSFSVQVAHDGPSAVELARDTAPDVVVLDLGLPGLDGIAVCQQLRQFSDCYVIMLTARTDEVDVLIGLSVGADDYVTKPFSPRELVARIKTVLRRPRAEPVPSTVHRVGSLEVDEAAHEVRVDGRAVELTTTEFRILATLAAAPRVVFARRQLLDTVWDGEWYGDERLVDVHVRNLRRKLHDDPAEPRFVRTVRGVGYRLGSG
jgi:DNA-binding response OmpR family regulator